MDILTAIEDVKAELLNGTDPKVALASVAEDNGVPLVMLTNRAKLALGELETYAARQHEIAEKLAEGNAETEQRRKEEAARQIARDLKDRELIREYIHDRERKPRRVLTDGEKFDRDMMKILKMLVR